MKKLLSVLFCLMMIGMTVLPAFADGQQTITEVRLSITQPAVCEAPDMTIESAEPDKYNAKVRYWIKQMHSDESVEAFEAGYEYTLVLDVTPVNGYKFADVKKNDSGFDESPAVVYVNSQLTRCVSAETNTKLGRAYDVTLTAVEEKPVSLLRRVINTIKCFFAKIADFFKNLFGLK